TRAHQKMAPMAQMPERSQVTGSARANSKSLPRAQPTALPRALASAPATMQTATAVLATPMSSIQTVQSSRLSLLSRMGHAALHHVTALPPNERRLKTLRRPPRRRPERAGRVAARQQRRLAVPLRALIGLLQNELEQLLDLMKLLRNELQ